MIIILHDSTGYVTATDHAMKLRQVAERLTSPIKVYYWEPVPMRSPFASHPGPVWGWNLAGSEVLA